MHERNGYACRVRRGGLHCYNQGHVREMPTGIQRFVTRKIIRATHNYYLQPEQIKLDLWGQAKDSPTMYILTKANGKWSCGKYVFLNGYAILNSWSVRDSVQETTDSDLIGQSVDSATVNCCIVFRRTSLRSSTIPSHKHISLNNYVTLTPLFIYFFDVLLTVHLSIFISVINQLDAQNFCFTISLFYASSCFEQMRSSSGGQNCITQPLVSSHWNKWVA